MTSTLPLIYNEYNTTLNPDGTMTSKIIYTQDQKVTVESRIKRYSPRDKKMWVSIKGFSELLINKNISKKDLAVFSVIMDIAELNNPFIKVSRDVIMNKIKAEYPNFYIDAPALSRALTRLVKAGVLIKDPKYSCLRINVDLFGKGSFAELHAAGWLEA